MSIVSTPGLIHTASTRCCSRTQVGKKILMRAWYSTEGPVHLTRYICVWPCFSHVCRIIPGYGRGVHDIPVIGGVMPRLCLAVLCPLCLRLQLLCLKEGFRGGFPQKAGSGPDPLLKGASMRRNSRWCTSGQTSLKVVHFRTAFS